MGSVQLVTCPLSGHTLCACDRGSDKQKFSTQIGLTETGGRSALLKSLKGIGLFAVKLVSKSKDARANYSGLLEFRTRHLKAYDSIPQIRESTSRWMDESLIERNILQLSEWSDAFSIRFQSST